MIPRDFTPGKIRFKASAAACALGFPLPLQSSKLKRGWFVKRDGCMYEKKKRKKNVQDLSMILFPHLQR